MWEILLNSVIHVTIVFITLRVLGYSIVYTRGRDKKK